MSQNKATSKKVRGNRLCRSHRRVETKKIEDEEGRQISFSKRIDSLLARANALSSLPGVELAFVTRSPGGEPHAFVSPNFKAAADQYISTGPANPADTDLEEVERRVLMHALCSEMAHPLETTTERRARLLKELREALDAHEDFFEKVNRSSPDELGPGEIVLSALRKWAEKILKEEEASSSSSSSHPDDGASSSSEITAVGPCDVASSSFDPEGAHQKEDN